MADNAAEEATEDVEAMAGEQASLKQTFQIRALLGPLLLRRKN
jgi:hypothetical protein